MSDGVARVRAALAELSNELPGLLDWLEEAEKRATEHYVQGQEDALNLQLECAETGIKLADALARAEAAEQRVAELEAKIEDMMEMGDELVLGAHRIGGEVERAAIVAWLRADDGAKISLSPHRTLDIITDGIEQGAHLEALR